MPIVPDATSLPISKLPDVRQFPLGSREEGRAAADAVILKRVVRRAGDVIPVASFQSAL